ncbi:hypothetical protein E3W21_27295 [Pseudomonas sp. F01002]|nr:hypothetical protein E3W21_27295 [Pseudomonas sp. F01002]
MPGRKFDIGVGPMWERACSRKRSDIQHLRRMLSRLREQARSHKGFEFGSQFAGAASCDGGAKSNGASANPLSSTCNAHP